MAHFRHPDRNSGGNRSVQVREDFPVVTLYTAENATHTSQVETKKEVRRSNISSKITCTFTLRSRSLTSQNLAAVGGSQPTRSVVVLNQEKASSTLEGEDIFDLEKCNGHICIFGGMS